MYVDKVGGMPEATSVIKANLLKHLQYNGKIFLVHLHMPKSELHDSSESTFSLPIPFHFANIIPPVTQFK